MAAALPYIPAAGGLIGTILGRNVGGPSPFEQAAMSRGAAGAGQLVDTGRQLSQFAQPLLGKAASYYQTILGGSRSAQNQLLQPEIAQITDTYRGAERNLSRSGVRGAQRDVATAELGRDRAGHIAGLIPGLRPGAAGALTQMGQTATSQGIGATSSGVGGFSSLLSGSQRGRQLQHQIGSDFGEGLGGITADIMSGVASKGGGGGGLGGARSTSIGARPPRGG